MVHNASDGRPRPIAAVVVIEPDDGHVMSRVVQLTEINGARYSALRRRIFLPPFVAQKMFRRGKPVARFRGHAMIFAFV